MVPVEPADIERNRLPALVAERRIGSARIHVQAGDREIVVVPVELRRPREQQPLAGYIDVQVAGAVMAVGFPAQVERHRGHAVAAEARAADEASGHVGDADDQEVAVARPRCRTAGGVDAWLGDAGGGIEHPLCAQKFEFLERQVAKGNDLPALVEARGIVAIPPVPAQDQAGAVVGLEHGADANDDEPVAGQHEHADRKFGRRAGSAEVDREAARHRRDQAEMRIEIADAPAKASEQVRGAGGLPVRVRGVIGAGRRASRRSSGTGHAGGQRHQGGQVQASGHIHGQVLRSGQSARTCGHTWHLGHGGQGRAAGPRSGPACAGPRGWRPDRPTVAPQPVRPKTREALAPCGCSGSRLTRQPYSWLRRPTMARPMPPPVPVAALPR